MRKTIIFLLLLCMHYSARGQTQYEYLYWFDSDMSTAGKGSCAPGAWQMEVDMSLLPQGYHNIYMQVTDEKGVSSAPVSRGFYKAQSNQAVGYLNFVCYIDDELFKQERVLAENGKATWVLDVSKLPIGLHKLQMKAIMDNGTSTAYREAFFLRVAMDSEANALSCLFYIDGEPYKTVENSVRDGVFHCDLDVASLSEGLHKISCILINNLGEQTTMKSQYFIKQPLGGYSIKKYQYWLNDNDDKAHLVVQDKLTDSLRVIALLPVDTQPLRSSLFHFEVKDGQPMIYAKNVFHARFYDTTGRFTDANEQYIDYNVGQKVDNIEWLASGVRKTIGKPEENTIKWYQLTAERGDSLAFKTSVACTLQLFSASGKEVYAASASEVVKWGGIHATEEGTYYLALHDVTAQQSNTVSLDYQHIDKYAVLRQDVSVVGNGGCSTITFEGNGFRDLYAVDLFTSQGDSIHHLIIGHESDATTSVAFDFTDASLGTYHAKFRFAGEDKVFNNLVTVEEPRDIEIATTVTYPSSFLRGTSTTYTIKITNKGNMTAYHVPIYTYIQSNSEDGVSGIKYDGLGLGSYADAVSIDGMSEKDKEIIQSVSDELGDDWQFLRFIVPNGNDDGDSVFVRSNYFFTHIPPNTTKELTLTLCSTEDVAVYVTVPPDWKELSSKPQFGRTTNMRNSPKQSEKGNYCCIREGVECLADIGASRLDAYAVAASIVKILGLAAGQVEIAAIAQAINIADCLAAMGNSALKTVGLNYCNDESAKPEDVVKTGNSWLATLMGCAGGDIGNIAGAALGNYGNYGEIMKSISRDFMIPGIPIGIIYDAYKCSKKFGKPAPGCPSVPPKGGSSKSVNSLDPNDIFGYTAESGSHAVKEGLTDVYYRIEFENDTTFATAAAHEVVVTDTLDATKFDFSTFAPTRVKIGEKSTELSGDKDFVTTIDMRPDINAIAQVEGTFDQQKGIARWYITSLDPMTMEPTDDVMQGVLPVNHNGNGIGELSYDINLKSGLAHGAEINNHACIVFDQNEPIMTPTWTNTIDRIAPESHITDVQVVNDSTAAVTISAGDDGSGPWRYDVYVQYGEGSAWFLAAENVPADSTANVKVYEGIDHGFYVVCTDMAGNVEQKEPAREFALKMGEVMAKGDINSDGKVDVSDYIGIANRILGQTPVGFNEQAADVNGDGVIDVSDYIGVANIILTGNIHGK